MVQSSLAVEFGMDIQDFRSDSNKWHILQERARALALHQVDTDIEQGDEILTFRLGEDNYSLSVSYIREVQPLESWTPLPTTPEFVIGLVNVRGKILTALDIRPLLNIAQTAPDPDSFLIIVQAHNIEVGLLADSVVEVQRDQRELSPTLSTIAGHGVPWVQGIDQNLNLLLDPSLLFTDPRVIVNDELK
jgi:purine-binding chemotaxis protein CheW